MDQTQIIGISLVRNEDIFIERSILNILEFCDRLIVADNLSTDGTGEIVAGLAGHNEKIDYRKINSLGESHDLIKNYAGSRTWVFGVDGDEIYDPAGLAKFRDEILIGKYEKWWQLMGNVLNCVDIDYEKMEATGYLAPPSRSMTKLFNFGAITGWDGGCPERLHGGEITFKQGWDKSMRLKLHKEKAWEESIYRCLHTCFLPRSSKDTGKNIVERQNPPEMYSKGALDKLGLGFFRRWFSGPTYKNQKYMRGDLARKNIKSFL